MAQNKIVKTKINSPLYTSNSIYPSRFNGEKRRVLKDGFKLSITYNPMIRRWCGCITNDAMPFNGRVVFSYERMEIPDLIRIEIKRMLNPDFDRVHGRITNELISKEQSDMEERARTQALSRYPHNNILSD